MEMKELKTANSCLHNAKNDTFRYWCEKNVCNEQNVYLRKINGMKLKYFQNTYCLLPLIFLLFRKNIL